MKPGYKTSEFWLTLAANLVGAVLASGLVGDESGISKGLGVAAMALASLGYSVSRGQAKASASVAEAKE